MNGFAAFHMHDPEQQNSVNTKTSGKFAVAVIDKDLFVRVIKTRRFGYYNML